MNFILAIIIAVFLDLLIGDPPGYPHPVRLIGKLIKSYETHYRKYVRNEKIAGFCTLCSVLLTVFIVTFAVLEVVAVFSLCAQDIAAIFVLYACIALKDLRHEAQMVYDVVERGDIEASRKQVARIVGRDTSELSETGVIKATVETVAENLSDGVIAPLFWAISIGYFAGVMGADALNFAAYGAIVYKAINTMDSMIGYKNEKYIYFGRSAAYLDDYANFVPARITGFIIIFLAFMLNRNGMICLKIFLRDRHKHTSPNAGHPEAAIAGMLGVELCGPSIYFGQKVEKPFIGDRFREIQNSDIILTNFIAILSLFVFLFFFLTACYFLAI